MEWILLWVVMAFVVAIVAGSKGRNGFGWFIYGFLIWPVALVHAICISTTLEHARYKAAADGLVACPHCAEMIRREAKVCRFCNRDVRAAEASHAAT